MRSIRGMANLPEKRKNHSAQLKVEQRPCKAEYQNDEEWTTRCNKENKSTRSVRYTMLAPAWSLQSKRKTCIHVASS